MIKIYKTKRLNDDTFVIKISHKARSSYKPSYTYSCVKRLEQFLNHLPQEIKRKKRGKSRLSRA